MVPNIWERFLYIITFNICSGLNIVLSWKNGAMYQLKCMAAVTPTILS